MTRFYCYRKQMAAKHEPLTVGTYLLVKVAGIRKPYLMQIESLDTQLIVATSLDQPHFTLHIPRIEGHTLEQVSVGDGAILS